MPRHLVGLIAVGVALAGVATTGAQAAPLSFSAPQALPNSLPSSDSNHPQRQGGEPSVVFDPANASLLYAASPGGAGFGGNFWRSTDGGRTFSAGISVGSMAGGGDSDVAVGSDPAHTVYYADLEDLVASDLCRSTDHGQSFPNDGCSTGFATNQQEPAVDRPWLTTVPGKPNLLYGTYDGLAFGGGAPEVQQSTDGGTTNTPCGQVLEPGSSAFSHFSPTGALENSEVIGKPAVGPDGSLYVPFTEPHQQGQQASESSDPTPDNLYIGIAQGGCPAPTSTFHDVAVFENDQGLGSDFANIFPSVAVDGGGVVYALGAGRLREGQKGEGVYLFVSRDKGLHWSKPIQVNPGPPEAAVLPAIAGGLGSGQALIGWYASTTSTDHNSSAGRWRYYAAETFDGGRTFSRATVTPSVFHYGAVCTLGVECTGGRNLLDFTSVAVNPKTGCGYLIFGGDPYDTPTATTSSAAAAYTSRQVGGRCLTKAKPRPRPRRHRRAHRRPRHRRPPRHRPRHHKPRHHRPAHRRPREDTDRG